MSTPGALQYGGIYHIYNRGNNRETLFRQENNYRYFMELYWRHIFPVADTFTYCLLPNHFHLLVRVKSEEEILKTPSQHFGNLFNAYTKAINKAFERTGSLFEKPFHRKLVTNDDYLCHLILYIHHNPQKHGISDDFRMWPFSSYTTLLSDLPTRLKRNEVLTAFGDRKIFIQQHDRFQPGDFDQDF